MAVLLTISETAGGSAVNDTLENGGSGVSFGSVINGQYAPLISQAANTGHKNIFIRHNAVDFEITSVKTFLQAYGVGTGFTYGGATDPNTDLATLLDMGAASASANANNIDGLAAGLHIDMDWQVTTVNQFAPARIGTQVRIYGDNGGAAAGEGRNLASAITMHADAMSYWNGTTEADASAPVAGYIGITANSALGNRAHPRMRMFLSSGTTDGGYMQWEWVVSFSYTS